MKILFIGPMGAGKTTAITVVSDVPAVTTEALNNDLNMKAKATTTVAMDFGEINLGDGETIALYGIPGQKRFSFMWPILVEGAIGAILLLDGSADDSQEQLIIYLDAFFELAKRGMLVIGVGRLPDAPVKALEPYHDILRQRGLALPVLTADVRIRQSVLFLVESLIASAEVSQLLARDHL